MPKISRPSLFKKLNSLTYKAIESATVFCKLRGNPNVELIHWLNQIIQLQDSDLHKIIQHFSINHAHLSRDLTQALDKLPNGATAIEDFSSQIDAAIKESWLYSTLLFNDSKIRSGYLVVGLLKTPELKNTLLSLSKQFALIKEDELVTTFSDITQNSPENSLAATDGSQLTQGDQPGVEDGAVSPALMGKQEALKKYTIDLTAKAQTFDPIVGRENEIRQMIDILMRRRQNNPILTGEAGVGKTAVVEGFAQRIAQGDVPPPLQNVTIRNLDLALLQAGASMKGEFEERLKQIIEEVQSSSKPIILFIDEAHTLIGAGGAAGTGDAANLLKPALARGKLRTIAATTWAEYKKYFEKDPALTRRFQVVNIDEPDEEKAILMLRSMSSVMEKHHQVTLLDEALEAAVKLSHRYIPARQLPDKAVSVLDTAAARVAVSQYAIPAEIEDCEKQRQALDVELAILERESRIGIDQQEKQTKLTEQRDALTDKLDQLNQRWQQEKSCVEEILTHRKTLRDNGLAVDEQTKQPPISAKSSNPETITESSENNTTHGISDEEQANIRQTLQALQQQLIDLQGESPLILPAVDAQAIASIIADWTGIPVGRMVHNEIKAVLELSDTLNQRIIGQKHALDSIAKRVQTARAGLDSPDKPIGVFLLCGSSGVGKTETGLALAEALYGGEDNIITINMSEFQEAHSVSTLKGSPPGYVGYGEGGILTEAVRRRPYSVILLDEVEKAHPDVHEIFFQVFDKGRMEDAEGRLIDFRNTLILLTSNVGTELILSMCQSAEQQQQALPDIETLNKALHQPLMEVFPPALLGRLVTIPYYPLSDEILQTIIRLKLNKIVKRIQENHQMTLNYSDNVIDLIAARCQDIDSGARVVDMILTNTVLPQISQEILKNIAEEKTIQQIQIDTDNNEFTYIFIND